MNSNDDIGFQELISSGGIDKPQPIDDYVEVDVRDHATLRAVSHEVGLIRAPRGQRLHESIDNHLKAWARGYKCFDRNEIRRDTGNGGSSFLGKIVRQNNKSNDVHSEPQIELDDSSYRRLSAVVNSMTEYNRMFIYRHYIERSTGIRLFCEEIGMKYGTYRDDLSDAKQEFAVRSGLN